MRLPFLLLCTGAVVTLSAHAQDQDSNGQNHHSQCPEIFSRPVRAFSFNMDGGNRAAIGITTTSGGMRDTLGLLVTEVVANGPADKAQIEEGDRLQRADGTDLRLSPADAGDHEMRGLMARRLIRVLDKLKPGDPVELQVYFEGKVRTVKVTTVKASEAFHGGMFGLDLPGAGNFVLNLARLQDEVGAVGDNLRGLEDHINLMQPMDGARYDLPPGSYMIDVPPAPPVLPVPPVPAIPATPATPATPPPPAGPLDAPRRTMRIRAVVPATAASEAPVVKTM